MQRILITIAVLAVAAAAGWWLAAPRHSHEPQMQTSPDGEVWWTCTMHPEVRMDAPGNCPICGMKLVERRADVASGTAGAMAADTVVRIAPQMQQSLGIRSASVERGTFWQRVDAPGRAEVDARRIRTIESRAPGWIEDQRVHAAGERVRAGERIAGIYAPELYAAQEELLLARRDGDTALEQAARRRLSLLGADDAQIASVLRSGRALRALPLLAPIDGVVLDLDVHEGRQIAPGMPLARIADLSRIWVLVDVPETQAAWLAVGRPAEVRFDALPGEVFEGTVEELYPGVDALTRTRRLRVVLDNPQWRIEPGMYAAVALFGGPRRDVLMIPSEALIRTGTRSMVIVAGEDACVKDHATHDEHAAAGAATDADCADAFRPVAVEVGAERAGRTLILSGLEEGQRVVVSGQFLIDSEASLRGAFGRMQAPAHDHGATP